MASPFVIKFNPTPRYLAGSIEKTPGTYTSVVTVGVSQIFFRLWSGGGAGAGYQSSAHHFHGGGGAGCFWQGDIAVRIGDTLVVVVGSSSQSSTLAVNGVTLVTCGAGGVGQTSTASHNGVGGGGSRGLVTLASDHRITTDSLILGSNGGNSQTAGPGAGAGGTLTAIRKGTTSVAGSSMTHVGSGGGGGSGTHGLCSGGGGGGGAYTSGGGGVSHVHGGSGGAGGIGHVTIEYSKAKGAPSLVWTP